MRSRANVNWQRPSICDTTRTDSSVRVCFWYTSDMNTALHAYWLNLRRALSIAWQSKPGLSTALLFLAFAAAVLPFGVSALRGKVIDGVVDASVRASAAADLWFLVGAMAIGLLVSAFVSVLQQYCSKRFWLYFSARFEMDLAKKQAEVDMASYEDPATNNLFTKVHENGVWRLENFIDRQFQVIQELLSVITATIVLGLFQWWFVLVLVLGTLPELLVELRYGAQVWGIYGANAELKRRYWSIKRHFEWPESVAELKLFRLSDSLALRMRTLYAGFIAEQNKVERKKLLLASASLVVSQAAVIAVLVWAVFLVLQGQILIGAFTFVWASITDFRGSLSGLFRNLSGQYQDSLFVTDLFTVLDMPPVIPKPDPGKRLGKTSVPDIAFEHVSFRYPGTERWVLRDINLHVSAGTKMAFVGVNGAGKTTLVKLLCRFYDPTEGRILINGVDLRELQLDGWYDKMGVLFQEYNRYQMPVGEGIALGSAQTKFSLARVRDAAVGSEADTFISKWEKGYEQELGKQFTGGIEPSVGQWQKLALARVLYRDPAVYILDEPTASVDAEAEAHIFEKLESVAKGKTMLLISHRFSTVRKADSICVLSEGGVLELGSHADLLAQQGTYARLFKLQAKGYE